VKGRVRRPKLSKDETRLKQLCVHCRNGDFREVRALVTHFPYLLSLTDNFGFGPLHHAEMSNNPWFVAQVLKLYRNPKTFALKVVTYEAEEDLLRDQKEGFEFRLDVVESTRLANMQVIRVVSVGPKTAAAAVGVAPGDVLETVGGESFPQLQPMSQDDDVLIALGTNVRYPLTLELRGSAATQALSGDGWTPSHGAACHGTSEKHEQVLAQLLSEDINAVVAQDVCGCTAMDLYQLSAEQDGPPPRVKLGRRRPLSAGPRGAFLARDMQEGKLHAPTKPSPGAAVAATATPTSQKPRPPKSHADGVAAAWANRIAAVQGLELVQREADDEDDQDSTLAPPPCGISDLQVPCVGTCEVVVRCSM